MNEVKFMSVGNWFSTFEIKRKESDEEREENAVQQLNYEDAETIFLYAAILLKLMRSLYCQMENV